MSRIKGTVPENLSLPIRAEAMREGAEIMRDHILSNPSEFGLVSREERNNPLINAARGRDACGINHDELSAAHEAEIKELTEQAYKLADALRELVQVKEWKDKHGKDEHYCKAQPIAWSNAQQTLTEYEKLK